MDENSLEDFIPTRLTCITLLKASITVTMAEFNLLHILLPAVLGHKVPYPHTHLCTHDFQLYWYILCFAVFFLPGFSCADDYYTVPSSKATACTSYAGRAGDSGALCTNVWHRAHPHCQQPQRAFREPTAPLLHPLVSEGSQSSSIIGPHLSSWK